MDNRFHQRQTTLHSAGQLLIVHIKGVLLWPLVDLTNSFWWSSSNNKQGLFWSKLPVWAVQASQNKTSSHSVPSPTGSNSGSALELTAYSLVIGQLLTASAGWRGRSILALSWCLTHIKKKICRKDIVIISSTSYIESGTISERLVMRTKLPHLEIIILPFSVLIVLVGMTTSRLSVYY